MMKRTYRMLGRIEPGELADLFLGVRDDDEEVLIKLFHARAPDPAYIRELAEVARVLNPLGGEGIVHLLEMGTLDQRLVVIREFIDGVSLGEALERMAKREVSLAPAAALLIVLDVLSAVERAHQAGISHGAITPGNVLLGKDGQGSVCDFGVLRAGFTPKGRESYRSPEVSRGEDASVRSDIYSIAAIAYELLTLREARLPSQAGSSVPLLPPSKLAPGLPAQLDSIILRGLELQPQRRHPDCGELAVSLQQVLLTLGGSPGRDELRRFVRRLYVADRAGFKLHPPPLTESFSLTPLESASFPLPLQASASVKPRRPSPAVNSTELGMVPTEVIIFPDSPPPTKTLDWAPPDVEPFVTEPAVKETNAPDLALELTPPPLIVPAPPLSPPPAAALPPPLPPPPNAPASAPSVRVSEPALEPQLETESLGGPLPFRPLAPLLVPRPPSPGSAAPTVELPRIVVDDVPDSKRRSRRRGMRPVLGVRHFPLTAWIWVILLLLAVMALGGWLGLQRLKQQNAQVVQAEPAAPGDELAYLSVFSDVPSELTVDGVRLPGQTPIQGFPLVAGKRKLVLKAIKGGHRRELEVVLKAGHSRRLDVSLGERAR